MPKVVKVKKERKKRLSGAAYRKRRKMLLELKKLEESQKDGVEFVKVSEFGEADTQQASVEESGKTQTCGEDVVDIFATPDVASDVAMLSPRSDFNSDDSDSPILVGQHRVKPDGASMNDDDYMDLNDVGQWPETISEELQELLIRRGPEVVQHLNDDFSAAVTVVRGSTRRFTKTWFYRTLSNGEKILRTWLAYSPSKASVFCFCCRLFRTPKSLSNFCSDQGWNNWGKLNPKIAEHEAGSGHVKNYFKWKTLEKAIQQESTFDNEREYKKQAKQWQDIFVRMFDIIKYLAKQNLGVCGFRDEVISNDKDKMIDVVHLLGKYDPVLREHIVRMAAGETVPDALSPVTQTEFIKILGDNVRQHILGQVKKAKYYSMIFDTTTDVSNENRTSLILRYVTIENYNANIVESFIDFIDTRDRNAQLVVKNISAKLPDLEMNNCRGQVYDTAVMTSKRINLRQRIKGYYRMAEFLPCSNGSLCIACIHAASSDENLMSFFTTFEKCFKFFAASDLRWRVLLTVTGSNLSKGQGTRWSERSDVVNMMCQNYKSIMKLLVQLTDPEESFETRSTAAAMIVSFRSFPFFCCLDFWNKVILNISNTEIMLTSDSLNLNYAAEKLEDLQTALLQSRDELVDGAVRYAEEACGGLGVTVEPDQVKKEQVVKDPATNAIVLTEAGLSFEAIRRGIYNSLDSVTTEIGRRLQQLQELAKKYTFLTPAYLLDSDFKCDLEHVSLEVNVEEFKEERERLHKFLVSTGDLSRLSQGTAFELLCYIVETKFDVSVPHIVILLRVFLTSATCDRSPCKRDLVNKYLRSPLGTLQTNLAIISIEQDLLDDIDIDSVIEDFALKKARSASIDV